SKPRLLAGADFFSYTDLRTAVDRATPGSNPSAAVCSERHGRPPLLEAVGLLGRSHILMPVLPKAINPSNLP
ncbi:MAG: hypothetical protein JSU63_09005, partial [Phycisphaerales bacterium]